MSDFIRSKIRILWDMERNFDYEYKGCFDKGRFGKAVLFWQASRNREVSGKLVNDVKEGEEFHWILLTHTNLLPLIDTIQVDSETRIFMSPWYGSTLYETVSRNQFYSDSKAFHRKKAYIEDVLWGLDYIHKRNMCLVNVNEENILICYKTDRAIIGNFSCLLPVDKVTADRFAADASYAPPEVKDLLWNELFDGKAGDIWAFGVMTLSVFCGSFAHYFLKSSCSFSDRINSVMRLKCSVNREILNKANPCSTIPKNISLTFRYFINKMLADKPNSRSSADCVAIDNFLRDSFRRSLEVRDLNELGSMLYNRIPSREQSSSHLTDDGIKTVRSNPFSAMQSAAIEMTKNDSRETTYTTPRNVKVCLREIDLDARKICKNNMPTESKEETTVTLNSVGESVLSSDSCRTSNIKSISNDSEVTNSEVQMIIHQNHPPKTDVVSALSAEKCDCGEESRLFEKLCTTGRQKSKVQNVFSVNGSDKTFTELDIREQFVCNEKIIDSESMAIQNCSTKPKIETENDSGAIKIISKQVTPSDFCELSDCLRLTNFTRLKVVQNDESQYEADTISKETSYGYEEKETFSSSSKKQVRNRARESNAPPKRRDSFREAVRNDIVTYLERKRKDISKKCTIRNSNNSKSSVLSFSTDREVSAEQESTEQEIRVAPKSAFFRATKNVFQKRRFRLWWAKMNLRLRKDSGTFWKIGRNHDSTKNKEKNRAKLSGKRHSITKDNIIVDLPEEIESNVCSDSAESFLLLNFPFSNDTLEEQRRKLPKLLSTLRKRY